MILDEDKYEKKMQLLNSEYKKTMNSGTCELKDNPHEKPYTDAQDGSMHGPLMGFTQMLEAMDEIQSTIESDTNVMDDDVDIEEVPTMGASGSYEDNEEELLNQLNQIFTPILIMNQYSTSQDKIVEAMSEASVLTENNIIQFDDASRMAQLISTCALLIARQKDSKEYQMFKKASEIKKGMKLKIQESENAAAKALAQKFLVKVSTTNNSSVARQSANDLLPQTQH